jgi:hypothetical protein
MPLRRGKSKKVIGYNIAKEMRHGKPQKQAIAIAMSMAGMSKGKKVSQHHQTMKSVGAMS